MNLESMVKKPIQYEHECKETMGAIASVKVLQEIPGGPYCGTMDRRGYQESICIFIGNTGPEHPQSTGITCRRHKQYELGVEMILPDNRVKVLKCPACLDECKQLSRETSLPESPPVASGSYVVESLADVDRHERCFGCTFATDSFISDSRKVLLCTHPPYCGKWVIEIENCPKGVASLG